MACTWDNGSGFAALFDRIRCPFSCCLFRVPRPSARAIIRTTNGTTGGRCRLSAVRPQPIFRPLFVESGGAHLAGFGHPAFLANVCLPAIYACLIQLYREGQRGDLLLLEIVNFLILVLTGARDQLHTPSR